MRASHVIRVSAVAALALAQFYGSPAAAQSIPVSAGSNASSLVGVDFLLPIEIDMSQRTDTLQSFALTLRWNAAVLELVGGGPGTFGELESTDEDLISQGVIQLRGTNTRNIGGRFSVAVGRFRPLVAATDTIRVSVEELIAKTSLDDLRPQVALTDRSYCPALGRWGDADGNGLINTRDALIALSAAVGLDVSQFNAALADVDGDGSTQAVDALIILSRALGIDVGGSRLFSIAPGSCAPSTALASFFLIPGNTTVATGSTIEYSALATDSSGATVAVVDVFWRVSNLRVAAVTPEGAVHTLDTGTTVVTAFRSGTLDSAQSTVTVIGTDILFFSDRDGNLDIYRMSATLSGAPTNLTKNPASELDPAWSPDRNELEFAFASDRSGNFDIYIADIDGTGVTQLTTNTATDLRPHWSPDGTKIAFNSFRDENWEVYVINVDGTGLTNLTNDAARDRVPAWSPDGSRIAFSSDRDGDTDIYVMNADGTGVTSLTINDTIVDVTPAWSPDGSRIAFASGTGSERDIYVMNADGSNQVQLTFEDASNDRVPNFSPDGSLIVFVSDRDGDQELYVMNASDGSNVFQLTHNSAFDFRPKWR